MAPNPAIMQAVEQLGYRVTIGDVATQAGLNVNLAQQGLLALAADASGHLQVAESGEVVYLFPKNFRALLESKYFRLRLKQWWEKVWQVLFYLIRISFGIVLILLIVATVIALIVLNSSRSDNDDRRDNGPVFAPNVWIGPDWFWFIGWDTDTRQQERLREEAPKLNFLEAVFSFLFGDGDPNYNLEERRWQTISACIRKHQGAVTAEQIAPYLDDLGSANEYEDYMIPVLARFNGVPNVSPDGDIVYHFPELQTMAARRQVQEVPAYLQEYRYQFSQASGGQLLLAGGLGVLLLILALFLGSALPAAAASKLVLFQLLYRVGLVYSLAFLTVPLVRYFWLQWRNRRIESRNEQRQQQASRLSKAGEAVKRKLAYARQFATETIIGKKDLVYTTETDLLEQDVQQSARIDAEWQRRLDQSGS